MDVSVGVGDWIVVCTYYIHATQKRTHTRPPSHYAHPRPRHTPLLILVVVFNKIFLFRINYFN